MADTTIDLLKNSSYVEKMDELIAAVKLGGSAISDIHTALNRTNAVNVANSGYTTYMARGEALFAQETTPTVNGTIAWQYE